MWPEPPNDGRFGSVQVYIIERRDRGSARTAAAAFHLRGGLRGVAEAQFDPRGEDRRRPRFRRSSCVRRRAAGPPARRRGPAPVRARGPVRRPPFGTSVSGSRGSGGSSGTGRKRTISPVRADRRPRSAPLPIVEVSIGTWTRGARRCVADQRTSRRRRAATRTSDGERHASARLTAPSRRATRPPPAPGPPAPARRRSARGRGAGPSAISSSTSAVVALVEVLDEVGVLLGEAGAAERAGRGSRRRRAAGRPSGPRRARPRGS